MDLDRKQGTVAGYSLEAQPECRSLDECGMETAPGKKGCPALSLCREEQEVGSVLEMMGMLA